MTADTRNTTPNDLGLLRGQLKLLMTVAAFLISLASVPRAVCVHGLVSVDHLQMHSHK